MENFAISRNEAFDQIESTLYNSSPDYARCMQQILDSKPFGDHKFYIFSFMKRRGEFREQRVLYHQPRLTKPEPVPGTSLKKVDPNDPEYCKLIWALPDEESFKMYKEGRMFANEFVHRSIKQYFENYEKMCQPEPDDLSDEEIAEIYMAKSKRKKSLNT